MEAGGFLVIKKKPTRDKKYLKWVKSLKCCVTGFQADDPHHIIGHGQSGMATKASDLFTMPMTRQVHTTLHSHGYKTFEDCHGSQWDHVLDTMIKAVKEGVKDPIEFIHEIDSFVKDVDQAIYMMRKVSEAISD